MKKISNKIGFILPKWPIFIGHLSMGNSNAHHKMSVRYEYRIGPIAMMNNPVLTSLLQRITLQMRINMTGGYQSPRVHPYKLLLQILTKQPQCHVKRYYRNLYINFDFISILFTVWNKPAQVLLLLLFHEASLIDVYFSHKK